MDGFGEKWSEAAKARYRIIKRNRCQSIYERRMSSFFRETLNPKKILKRLADAIYDTYHSREYHRSYWNAPVKISGIKLKVWDRIPVNPNSVQLTGLYRHPPRFEKVQREVGLLTVTPKYGTVPTKIQLTQLPPFLNVTQQEFQSMLIRKFEAMQESLLERCEKRLAQGVSNTLVDVRRL